MPSSLNNFSLVLTTLGRRVLKYVAGSSLSYAVNAFLKFSANPLFRLWDWITITCYIWLQVLTTHMQIVLWYISNAGCFTKCVQNFNIGKMNYLGNWLWIAFTDAADILKLLKLLISLATTQIWQEHFHWNSYDQHS